MPRALLITGVSGVGKSTIAGAIGGLLSGAGLSTAVVDVDALAQFGPPPRSKGDFYHALKCANLAAVWATFKAAGARFVVVAAGVDSTAECDDFARSLDGCDVQTVRLTADAEAIRQRRRDRGDQAAKTAAKAATKDVNQTADKKADQTAAKNADQNADPGEPAPATSVRNDRPPVTVAREVLARAGWPGG
jgi:chloramphenicol 3-O-phosphotransferase